MAENQNTNISPKTVNPVAASSAAPVSANQRKTAAEIEAASKQKTVAQPVSSSPKPLFKPVPKEEKAAPKAAQPQAQAAPKTQQTSAPKAPTQPALQAQPKLASPLAQNSSKIAAAAGLTSAQIEGVAPKTSVLKTVPIPQAAPKVQAATSPAPKTQPAPANMVEKKTAIDSLSAKNAGASHKTLPQAGASQSSQNPGAKNPNVQKTVGDKTTFQKFINHNQIATGKFVHNLFGHDEKTAGAVAAPSGEKNVQLRLSEAEKIYQQGLASVRDLISPSSFEVHYDHLNLSGVYVRSFFVYAYPRFLETNWMSPIINFDATVDVAQFIYPIASDEIMKILEKKVAQIQSSIAMNTEKGNVRSPQLETALEDAESLRTDLQRGQEKFFQFGMYFTVYASDPKKLEATTKIIENQLGGKLVLTKRADIQGEHAFNSTLPLCIDELEVQRNMNTSPLSTTFPFVSSSLATDEGILYGLNRHNNSLIIFDRFKLPNANSCVFATSGAGKSYAVKLEILRQVMLGTDVIVVDPENEYKTLTETVGGTYLNVSLNSDQRINPFDLPQPLDGESIKPGDLLRENVITLTGLMKLMLGSMTAEEEALIDKALIDTYAVRGITMKIENPSEMPMPTMDDFYSVLSAMKGAEGLAQRLQKYTSGTFGGIFNRETNVDLKSGLIVFCIRDLEDELRPTAMFILLNYIWSRVRSELKRRILVVDEAWKMMQHEDSAKFLFGLVKRARKYYLGITTITQDVEDFLGSKYGRPIVTNASMQLLLKQAPSSMDILQKSFNLTEGEKYMLLNSGVGQGLFFADNKHVAVQVIASYSENQIVTTNPEELLAQRKAEFEKKN